MYLSGLRTGGLVHFNGTTLAMSAELPAGTHNARPFRNGVLFNDSEADRLRYAGRGDGTEDRAMAVPKYALKDLQHPEFDDGHVARQGFARGLAVVCPTRCGGRRLFAFDGGRLRPRRQPPARIGESVDGHQERHPRP